MSLKSVFHWSIIYFCTGQLPELLSYFWNGYEEETLGMGKIRFSVSDFLDKTASTSVAHTIISLVSNRRFRGQKDSL